MGTTAASIDARIVWDDAVMGGQPHIANRRIRVRDIVQWYDIAQMNADTIAADYDLDLADVFAALAYYFLNREVLQNTWAKDDVFVEELRQGVTSKIPLILIH